MINLIDHNDIYIRTDYDKNITGMKIKQELDIICQEKLELGIEQGQLVYTQDLRGIGKTYSLIDFAKKHNYYVVVNSSLWSIQLRKEYDYEHIYFQTDSNLRNKIVVIDEGIDIKRLLDEMGCKIITGFTNNKNIDILQEGNKTTLVDRNNKNTEEIELSFSEEVVKTLKEEVKMLDESMKNALKRGDASMYKNLVTAYRDVVKLVLDMDWKLMYSEYSYSTEEGKQVTVWEQNGDGQIRDHKIWDIKIN